MRTRTRIRICIRALHPPRPIRAALLAALGVFASQAHANLLVNGNFETGDLSGWTVSQGPSLVTPDPSNPFSVGRPFSAAVTGTRALDGAYSARIVTESDVGSDMPHSVLCSGTLSQTLLTTPGQEYTLSFLVQADQASPAQPSTITASFGGQLFSYPNDPMIQLYGWSLPKTQITTHVLASAASTTLSFYFVGGPVLIDDVSVTAVPEPAQWALMGLAALAIAATARRRTMRPAGRYPASRCAYIDQTTPHRAGM